MAREVCNHASTSDLPEPVKEYNAQGCRWTLCQSCGSRWVEFDGWRVPMPHSPAPGKPPTTTAKKYLGDRVHKIGEHNGKLIKDLPNHYLKWVLTQSASSKEPAWVKAYVHLAKPLEGTADQEPQPVRVPAQGSQPSSSASRPRSETSSARPPRTARPMTRPPPETEEDEEAHEEFVIHGETDLSESPQLTPDGSEMEDEL